MSDMNSSDFYRRRAAQAVALADAAKMPSVQQIHRDMAAHYTALAEPDVALPSRPTVVLAF